MTDVKLTPAQREERAIVKAVDERVLYPWDSMRFAIWPRRHSTTLSELVFVSVKAVRAAQRKRLIILLQNDSWVTDLGREVIANGG